MTDIDFKLNTGATIPALGLGMYSLSAAFVRVGTDSCLPIGTWQSAPGEVSKAVTHALFAGYRHIDCAYVYGNEDEVGQGLAEAFKSGKVKREHVFITTKLWCTYHSRVEENLDMSLKSLGLEYVDLYLMHWPVPMNPKGKYPRPEFTVKNGLADSIETHRQRSQIPKAP